MRPSLQKILTRAYSGARTVSRFIWSTLTSSALLTMLIALGTLATAIVTYRNGRVTGEQVELLKRQVDLNAAETRPFLRLKPKISLGESTRAFLDAFNLGPVPARIIGYDMVVQVGHNVVAPKGHTYINTTDILYAGQKGLGVFLDLGGSDTQHFKLDSDPIIVGGCVIYTPVTAGDARRWKVSTAYRFDRDEVIPLGLFTDEVAVPQDADSCDAGGLWHQWNAQLKLRSR
jgi:hypothetical protein